MASKNVIAVCQSGGEFVKEKDGTLSYNGGEAFEIDIDKETQLSYFKKEVAEMFDFDDVDSMIIKYFLPGNKKTLIKVSKDKDLARMVSFVEDSDTVDVFINSEVTPCARNMSAIPASRTDQTTTTEAMVQDPVPDADMGNVLDNDPIDGEIPSSTTFYGRSSSSYKKNHHKAPHQWENAITGVDQKFGSIVELREALHRYSIAHGFAYIVESE